MAVPVLGGLGDHLVRLHVCGDAYRHLGRCGAVFLGFRRGDVDGGNTGLVAHGDRAVRRNHGDLGIARLERQGRFRLRVDFERTRVLGDAI